MRALEVNPSSLTVRDKWKAPTVEEVELVWWIASWKFGVPVYKVHELIGIGERAARRWRSKSNAKDDGSSIIKYSNWALLVAMISGKSIIEKSERSVSMEKDWVMSVDKYSPPPLEVVAKFIGKDSYTGLTRSALGRVLGVHGDLLAKSADNLPFHLWAGILMHLNVPPSEMFDKRESVHELAGKYSDPEYTDNELASALGKLMVELD